MSRRRGGCSSPAPATSFHGSTSVASLPAPGAPEIAFAGRSNVGKSSLINALTNRKTLARTSNTPGRTQQLNFFDLGGKLRLVDMPGYGFAAVSRSTIAAWSSLIRDFLRGRAPLLRVYLLVDGRHGLKPSDVEIMDLFDASAISYAVVLTKADAVTTADRERTRRGHAGGARRAPGRLSRGSPHRRRDRRRHPGHARRHRPTPPGARQPALTNEISQQRTRPMSLESKGSPQEQAEILMQALPHMLRYDEATIVVKYGGPRHGGRRHPRATSPATWCCWSSRA